MFQTKVKSNFLILDFDIEARPLSYLGRDFTTKEPTAIAAKWINHSTDDNVYVWALGQHTAEEMLEGFVDLYNQAGMVTGHYIRGYDLSTINMSLVEYNMPTLSKKLTHDTWGDLVKQQGFSKSQENLGDMLGIERPKIGMSQSKWRDANRLTSSGIRLTKERVIGDVLQHIQLRQELINRKLLGKPKMWIPEK